MKKFLVLLLAVVLLFSGCSLAEEIVDNIKDEVREEVLDEIEDKKENKNPFGGSSIEMELPEVATPKPTPRPTIVSIDADKLNNYYVAYTVTKQGEKVPEDNGYYIKASKVTNYVEIGYSSVVLFSSDGGNSYSVGASQCFTSTESIQSNPKSIFSVHLNYEKSQLQKKGTATVAGTDCTVYYYKEGLVEILMYVDESFDSTGICLKYESIGYNPQTIEVTEIKFGVINSTPGYDFITFHSKVATPAPIY